MIEQLAAMPKYDAYKDSGVEWLGKIPAHWELSKLGSCLKPVSVKNRPDLPLLSITREKGVIQRNIEDPDENHNYIPDDLSNYKVLERGQFGMNKMKAWQGSYGVSDHTGIVSPAYFIFAFTKEIDSKFFHLAIRSALYISYFGSASDGVRIGQWDLSKPRMKEIPFLIPPVLEQTIIATFLDRKNEQLDQAVAIKEKQIALLKVRKQILIQNAVTRGLNPDAPMLDSGVEWIDKVPAHWGMKKLKYGIDILTGFPFTSENYSTDENDIRLLRGVNISPGYTKWDEVVYWSKDKISDYESYRLESGDLVIAMDRPWVSSGIRVAKIGSKDLPSFLLQRVARIRGVNNVLTDYVHLLLSTQIFLFYFEPMLTGVSVPHISSEQIESFVCPLPPENEQREILAHIETESAKIDQAISIQQQQIDKLKEYKATLINSAVTGKIKVPEFVEGKISMSGH